jgi:hypothetical protein
VQFGNARWASCGSVMLGNDDHIKEAIDFSFALWNRVGFD